MNCFAALAIRGEILYREDQWAVPVGGQGTPAEYSEGLAPAIERDWLVMHESGTFVKFGQADVFT